MLFLYCSDSDRFWKCYTVAAHLGCTFLCLGHPGTIPQINTLRANNRPEQRDPFLINQPTNATQELSLHAPFSHFLSFLSFLCFPYHAATCTDYKSKV